MIEEAIRNYNFIHPEIVLIEKVLSNIRRILTEEKHNIILIHADLNLILSVI